MTSAPQRDFPFSRAACPAPHIARLSARLRAFGITPGKRWFIACHSMLHLYSRGLTTATSCATLTSKIV